MAFQHLKTCIFRRKFTVVFNNAFLDPKMSTLSPGDNLLVIAASFRRLLYLVPNLVPPEITHQVRTALYVVNRQVNVNADITEHLGELNITLYIG